MFSVWHVAYIKMLCIIGRNEQFYYLVPPDTFSLFYANKNPEICFCCSDKTCCSSAVGVNVAAKK